MGHVSPGPSGVQGIALLNPSAHSLLHPLGSGQLPLPRAGSENRKPEPGSSWASTPTRTREKVQMLALLIIPCLPLGARVEGA